MDDGGNGGGPGRGPREADPLPAWRRGPTDGGRYRAVGEGTESGSRGEPRAHGRRLSRGTEAPRAFLLGRLTASTAAWVRSDAPSFARARWRYFFTVPTLHRSRAQISRFVIPWATRRAQHFLLERGQRLDAPAGPPGR